MGAHYLDHLFSPRTIAVFGASERSDSVGGRVFENLLEGNFEGTLYAINPKHSEVQGRPCYPSLQAIGEPVELAVIATPASTVPDILHECGENGVRTAIVHSAGFGEVQGEGARLQKAMLEEAKRYNLRVLGPNCLGLMRPDHGMNATFSKNTAQPGSLALVSQSGALCAAILDWAEPRRIGFSAVVSLGAAADVEFGDILDYLAVDPATHGILLYVEGITNARRFISGLRVAARMKPVVVIKAGRHDAGSKAAKSHTGAIVGSDDVFDAALRRAGVVRATTIEQLFAAAQLLATHHGACGNRLAIVSNAGGPGVMATDRAADLGVGLAGLDASTTDRLNAILPAHWSHANPVDILGDAPPDRYHDAVAACLTDAGVDGVLVMLTPQAMSEPLSAAEAVIEASKGNDKPVLACWMGDKHVEAARTAFSERGIPEFTSPETSVEAFAYLANYHLNQQLLLQVPEPLSRQREPDIEGANMILDGALAEGRDLLSAMEAHALLTAFHIPVVPAMVARSANDALIAAETIGFPVAMKVNSPAISHKSDVGGVMLNIGNAAAVRSAYNDLLAGVQQRVPDAVIDGLTVERMVKKAHGRELLVGVVRDPVFGPCVTFGAGGTAVEVVRDRAVELPPLNTYIASNMIRRTRTYELLGAFRHLPAVDEEAILQTLRGISEIACELPRIRELEINPLLADENGVVALDVRVVINLHSPLLDRYGHMAIHPYPEHLRSQFQLADGTDITIRPIRPEDAEIERTFVRDLSPQSKYFRFMNSLRELTPQMLVRFTQIDYDREMAFIAVTQRGNQEIEIGVSRYATNPDGETCEFALVVADDWQNKGIGTRLLGQLIDSAKAKRFRYMVGEVLTDNSPMLKLVKMLGFSVSPCVDDPGVRAVTLPL